MSARKRRERENVFNLAFAEAKEKIVWKELNNK